MNDTLRDSKHWRELAEKTRRKAEGVRAEDERQKLLRLANEYEELAERAAQQQAASDLRK